MFADLLILTGSAMLWNKILKIPGLAGILLV
jgi:hypothetical protein